MQPCADWAALEAEKVAVVDSVQAYTYPTLSKVCVGWCSINWALYRPVISVPTGCLVTTASELKTEIDKVLADPYNQSNLQRFADCVPGFSIPSANFGLTWESFDEGFQATVQAADCEFSRLASELTWIGNKPADLRAQAAQLRDEAAAATARYASEYTNNSKMALAVAVQSCNIGQINGIEDQIRNIQAQIADKIVIRSTKYASYWADFET